MNEETKFSPEMPIVKQESKVVDLHADKKSQSANQYAIDEKDKKKIPFSKDGVEESKKSGIDERKMNENK